MVIRRCRDGGFVGVLNQEYEILQAAVRRSKAIIIARNSN
jgi:hypothetical protein